MGNGILWCIATLQGGSRQWYLLVHCHTSRAVVSFGPLPQCKGVVGSGIPWCTATLQGGSRQWYPLVPCHTASGVAGSGLLWCTATLQGGSWHILWCFTTRQGGSRQCRLVPNGVAVLGSGILQSRQVGSGIPWYAATLMGASGQWYPLLRSYTTQGQWTMVSFGWVPHCWGQRAVIFSVSCVPVFLHTAVHGGSRC